MKDQVSETTADTDEDDIADEALPGRQEAIGRARKGSDPFADAFEKAEAEIGGEDEPDPAPKPHDMFPVC